MKNPTFLFILSELFAFLIQVLIFFCITLLISHFLTIESALIKFAENKIDSREEFVFTIIATIFVLGILTTIQRLINHKEEFFHKLIDDTLLEIPRVIYLFGSSIVATTISLGIYLEKNPNADNGINSGFFFLYTPILAFAFFSYGCGLKYFLVRKTLKSQ